MEYIYSVETTAASVAKSLGELTLSPLLQKELGEALKFYSGQIWHFATDTDGMLLSFICHNTTHILYCYTLPLYRTNGLLASLYTRLPKQAWQAMATNMSLPFFLSKGFIIQKSFSNFHKLIYERYYQTEFELDIATDAGNGNVGNGSSIE